MIFLNQIERAVNDIFTMYEDLRYSYNNLSENDKLGINISDIEFKGFDANSPKEEDYYSAAFEMRKKYPDDFMNC